MSSTGPQTLRGLAVRFAAGACLLAALMLVLGTHIEAVVLPWFSAVLRVADPDHQVVHLGLHEERGGRVLRMTVTRVRYVFVGDKALEPNASATAAASTLAGPMRLTLVLVLASAFAPRMAGWRARAWRALLAGGAALLSLALDMPLLLAAELRGLYHGAYDAQGWSPLTAWSAFVLDGGRYLVPLVLGAGAAWCAGWLGHAAPPAPPAHPNGTVVR